MTGRAAATAAGRVPGWAIAIAGDIFHFTVLMISTLWLNDVLGDERTTIFAMIVVDRPTGTHPALERARRAGGGASTAG